MNPYEKTVEEMKRQSEGPKRAAKTAIGIGAGVAAAGAASFAPILARAAPFLSQYIPENLAVKGLSKIHPNLGKFVDKALKSGYDFKEVKDFIGEQVTGSQEAAKEDRNIIEQYSPELHKYISDEVSKGRSPIEAAALAQHDKRFSSIINKLSKDHKTPWSSIIEAVYGTGQTAQPQNQGQNSQSQQQQQPQQQGQPNQVGQPGQGQQALMAILSKINQKLGQ